MYSSTKTFSDILSTHEPDKGLTLRTHNGVKHDKRGLIEKKVDDVLRSTIYHSVSET